MKAYSASTDYGEYSAIVWAENANQAKVRAQYTDTFSDESYINIRVKRIPLLDDMEDREPKDNPWLNEEIRLILVREYGFTCVEPNVNEDCDKCVAKSYCPCYDY